MLTPAPAEPGTADDRAYLDSCIFALVVLGQSCCAVRPCAVVLSLSQQLDSTACHCTPVDLGAAVRQRAVPTADSRIQEEAALSVYLCLLLSPAL